MSYVCTLLAANCDRFSQVFPSGGLLLVVAGALLTTVAAVLRTKLRDWLSTSWQALIALAIGAGGFFLDGGRAVPLIVGVLTALLCLLWMYLLRTRYPLGKWLVNQINRLAIVTWLRITSPYTFVLGVGLVCYALSQLGTWRVEIYWAEKLAENEKKLLVSFTVPPHNMTPTAVDRLMGIEENLHRTVNSVLRDSFSHLTKKTNILPEATLLNEYAQLRAEFRSGLENRRELIPMLLSYRQGVGSRVDVVLEPIFNEVSSKQFVFRFRLYKLDHVAKELKRLEWEVEVYGLDNEVRRAALVAVAELMIFVVRGDLNISKSEEDLLWMALIEDFKVYYKDFDFHIERRLSSWSDDDPAKKADCNGKDCLEQWVQFYQRDLPELDDESDRKHRGLKSQIDTFLSPVLTSAGERTGQP